MDKDYFLNHELIDNDPLLHFAFYGYNDKLQQKIDKANQKATELIFKKTISSTKNIDII